MAKQKGGKMTLGIILIVPGKPALFGVGPRGG